MRGAEAITAARLAGYPVEHVDIEVLSIQPERRGWTPPGLELLRDALHGRIEVYATDNPATLDLRCCHGLPVSVFADTYAAGMQVAGRAIEAEPASLTFCAADYAARYTPTEGLQAWDL